MTASDTHRAIDAVWRIESARLIAGLARIVRDVGLAEELAQDALVAALEQWPESGVPDNPGAWLMATAKHRAIDHLAPQQALERKHEEIGRELEAGRKRRAGSRRGPRRRHRRRPPAADVHRLPSGALDRGTRGAHAPPARRSHHRGDRAGVPGARGDLAQRIVRAKRTLAEAHVPFEVPRGAELAARLSSVLEVIYLIFNEGYSATAGDDWMRPALCEDALRLGRILAELMPHEPEVHGLVALMEIQASRARARRGQRASRSCCSIKIARAGISFSSGAVSPRWSALRSSARRVARTCSRLRSPLATRARRTRRPTGRGSRRCIRS